MLSGKSCSWRKKSRAKVPDRHHYKKFYDLNIINKPDPEYFISLQ
jgi:hypothetical protein